MSVSPDVHSFCLNKNHVSPTVDSVREEFRKYIENEAVLNVLTRVLKDLYEKETKPTDPLNFVITKIGALSFDGREIASLKDEIRDLRALIKDLQEENGYLKEKLEQQTQE
ncbi:hypothetical protein JTE90_005041 [Oedothorax gibbosus]|uniref:c-Myc-binding protein n=1 Tax=Oedothorax gibbosus TaxID=931172 RepID=A0AAV6VDL8_9ARAC|nr:hypothetical protein JTE90_005041 [Oedothorax gibbosus]